MEEQASDKITVVLAYSNYDDAMYVMDFLNSFEYNILQLTSFGYDCARAVNETSPDIVMCNTHLPDMNLQSVVSLVRKGGNGKTKFIAVESAPPARRQAEHLADVSFHSVIPFDYFDMHDKIKSVLSGGQRADITDKSHEIDSAVLRLLGGTYSAGCEYLRCGAEIAADSPDALQGLSKQLYPAIARRFDISSASVERSMRSAIMTAWKDGSGKLAEYFHEKPTSGKLIKLIYEQTKGRYEIK